ncbi:MAG TPA: flagellar FliJ family protein [Clostridia bacterium]|nr:flagellar FliJ family protein [Clostridia bacterium]
MKRFFFQFETILQTKTMLEKQHLNELARLKEIEKNLTLEYDAIASEYRENTEKYLTRSSFGIRAHDMECYSNYAAIMRRAMDKKLNEIKAVKKEQDKERKLLIEVRKERNMLESLKEKKHQEFLEQVEKEALKLLDERIAFDTCAGGLHVAK